MSDNGYSSHRQKVRDELGSEFAAKASDEFCAAYSLNFRSSRGGTVLELTEPPEGLVVPSDFQPRPGREAVPPPPRPRMRGGPPPPPVPEPAEPAPQNRDPRVRQAQLRSLWSMESIREELERAASAPRMRGGGGGTGGPPPQVCWLNRTMRIRARPGSLADVVGDPRVRRVDVTRPLVPEFLSKTVAALRVVSPTQERRARTGRGVPIAVIDSEVASAHPAFQDRIKQREEWNFTDERWGNPSKHGTAVAGVIAARGEQVGVAPDAIIYNYKVLGSTDADDADDFDLGCALQQALTDGARIANISLATPAATDGTSRETLACDEAWRLGLTVVKSAGNGGNAPGTMTCPADAHGVIVVGATDCDGIGVERYSGRGPTLNGKRGPDLVAPGGRDGIATVHSCLVDGTFGCCGAGTTLAAAHVTGLLALILEEEMGLTPDQQRDRLLALCEPLSGRTTDRGAGIPRWA